MSLEAQSPISIVIELDISPSETEKTYLDYLRLSNRYEVTLLYEEFNDRVSLVNYFKIICKYTGDENGKNSIKEIIDNKLSDQDRSKRYTKET